MPRLSNPHLRPRDFSATALSTVITPNSIPRSELAIDEKKESSSSSSPKKEGLIGKEKKKKISAKDLFFQRFSEKGFSSADIPKAIILHEIMGIMMLALTWSFCYLFPISQSSLLRHPIERIMNSMPKGLSNSISSNGFVNSRLGSSYIESSCLRKLIRPATLPAKLFLTFKLVEFTHQFNSSHRLNSKIVPAVHVQAKEQQKKGAMIKNVCKTEENEEAERKKKIQGLNSLQNKAKLFWKKGFFSLTKKPSKSLSLSSSSSSSLSSSLFDRFDAAMDSSLDDSLECLRELDDSTSPLSSSSTVYSLF